jgi:hypothetical protein
MDKLFEGIIRLEKIPGKGGWTYAALPADLPKSSRNFGMIRVKGSVDDFNFSQYNLMPMGDGRLFLPVKKEIRKKIHKEAGDMVSILLYFDDAPLTIPDDIRECLQDDAALWEKFHHKSTSFQYKWIKNIEASKTLSTRSSRLTRLIEELYLEKSNK